MSIAVSVVVKPSKLLQRIVCLCCLLISCLALPIGLGQVGDFPFFLRWAIAATLVLSAVSTVFYVFLGRKTFHIDISGIGQMRLKEDTSIDGFRRQQKEQEKGSSKHVVRLMENSTLWPYMLLLRLRAQDQRTRTLIILPDCMDSKSFRTLQVACRWIAAHNVHHADIQG